MEFFDFCNPVFLTIFITCICVLTLWEVIWKGVALWKAARNNDLAWFICIIVFNTVGILPIVYILMNRNKTQKTK